MRNAAGGIYVNGHQQLLSMPSGRDQANVGIADAPSVSHQLSRLPRLDIGGCYIPIPIRVKVATIKAARIKGAPESSIHGLRRRLWMTADDIT
jgi:hypothetical protein